MDNMSKICIVSVMAPKNMIMLYMYTTRLQKNNIPYDIVYLDRYQKEEETGAKHVYRVEYERKNKLSIIKGYLRFKKTAQKVLRDCKYKFVIVWNETTASILSGFLKRKYKGRYCVNVRDLFVGKRKLLNAFLKRSILNSSFTTVSSRRYLEELPKGFSNYYFVHSINDRIIEETKQIKRSENKNGIITILYLGNIRFYSHLYSFIGQIENDNRYKMIVAGAGSEPVADFVNKNKIINVEVFGTFDKEKTGLFLSRADVIFNLYGTEDINLRFALSNKLYYAVFLKIPILVYKNTSMFDVSNRCGIGFAVDDINNNPFCDKFYNWYYKLDKQSISKKCDELIEEARQSQELLYNELKKYL